MQCVVSYAVQVSLPPSLQKESCVAVYRGMELPWRSIQHKSNETPTWCNTVQVLFLQSHSTCFGRKLPSSGVFKTSTVATGTCVIVAGKSSHLLIRAGTEAYSMFLQNASAYPPTYTASYSNIVVMFYTVVTITILMLKRAVRTVTTRMFVIFHCGSQGLMPGHFARGICGRSTACFISQYDPANAVYSFTCHLLLVQ